MPKLQVLTPGRWGIPRQISLWIGLDLRDMHDKLGHLSLAFNTNPAKRSSLWAMGYRGIGPVQMHWTNWHLVPIAESCETCGGPLAGQDNEICLPCRYDED